MFLGIRPTPNTHWSLQIQVSFKRVSHRIGLANLNMKSNELIAWYDFIKRSNMLGKRGPLRGVL